MEEEALVGDWKEVREIIPSTSGTTNTTIPPPPPAAAVECPPGRTKKHGESGEWLLESSRGVDGFLATQKNFSSSKSERSTETTTTTAPSPQYEDEEDKAAADNCIINTDGMVETQQFLKPKQQLDSGSNSNSQATTTTADRNNNNNNSAGSVEGGEKGLRSCDSAQSNDVAECESRESKERFRQRLWCFLFENLNRSVDELYLLCELECDMEQIEEAILVLEESTSDFRELKSRVEVFNSTKNSIAHPPNGDGMLVNMKKETRRPHALSWEVRRMTNSPHKAEILSSSLEAFRRIQMERAISHVGPVSEVLGPRCHSQDVSYGHDENSSDAKTIPELTICSRNTNSEITENNIGTSKEMHKAKNSHIYHDSVPHGDSTDEVSLSEDNNVSKDADCKHSSKKRSPQNDSQASKDKVLPVSKLENSSNIDTFDKNSAFFTKEQEKDNKVPAVWKSMNAWKEKRNWEAILKSPSRNLSKVVAHSPSTSRKNVQRARTLHDKLMSPEKKKKTAFDVKKEAEDKHARAMRIRNQLETERVQRLQRTSEKLNRVNEWQAVRNLKLKEGMYARQQRGESRHEAYLAQVVKRAGDESSKVNEVRFITSLNEENRKLMLRQKLHDSEIRRAEKLQVLRTKQKEDMAKEEAALERRKLLEAEKLHRLAETQRRKEEAQMRREEERKASSAAREARAIEQLRRKEERAKAQQEEAELLAQKLVEKLKESEQRRKFYLEQIRERAATDFRDQSSPLLRRSLNKDGQSNLVSNEVCQTCNSALEGSPLCSRLVSQNQSLKRRVKKIRQKLMALKHDFIELSFAPENAGRGYRSFMGTAKVKIGRWLQDLQKLRQARKEGFASIGLIVGEITKFLEGKEAELHVSRQAGLVDFIASALPASHNSKPSACQVTTFFLRLLKVILSLPANRDYFLSQNLLPPIIPMLSSSLENYIKIAASLNHPGNTVLLSTKVSSENMESVAEILEGFLWTVAIIIGHAPLDERKLRMRDGLIELVVSYQIIHHLRDLFALYDRPQMEGSPFPSVILFSLNLLAVLTSRASLLSSTDGKYCLPQLASAMHELETTSTRISVSLGLCESPSIKVTSGDHAQQSFISEAKISSGLSFSSTSENKQLVAANEEKDPSTIPFKGSVFNAVETGMDTKLDMVIKDPVEEHSKLFSPSKGYHIDTNAEKSMTYEPANGNQKEVVMKQPLTLLIPAIAETGLVSLLSLLTAILLQANNKVSSELNCHVLPSNFEEVAIGVLRVLNNLALLNTTFLQNMLAMTDLEMEFFHLMSFLLSHCSSKWKVANDQVGQLLMECLSLLGYFSFLHTENQAVLRWGKSPTILHKICDLPFGFFSNPELMPILAGTLIAACYGSEQNRAIVQQEISIDMLLSLLKSCRQDMLLVQPGSLPPENAVASNAIVNHKTSLETKRTQGDLARSNRRSGKTSFGKGVLCRNLRANKSRIQKDSEGEKNCRNRDIKHKIPALEAMSFPLHTRLSSSFLDKAEEFFSGGIEPKDGEHVLA